MLDVEKSLAEETDKEEREARHLISRRKMLASLGMAGAAAVAGGLFGSTLSVVHGEGTAVTEDVYGSSVSAGACCDSVTIAELRAMTTVPDPGSVYYVRDYGQEGHFYYHTADSVTADNTGTVLVSVSGARFKRIYNGPVNVKWFGAKGDFVTNDTAAIQYCLDHFNNVYIPEGEFKTTGVVISRDNVNLFGSGKRTTTLATVVATDYVIRLYRYDLAQVLNYVKISDMTIEGNRLAKNGIYGGMSLSKIENVSIRGALEKGLYHVRGWSNHYNFIECIYNVGDGLVFNQEANNIAITNSEIHHNDNGVILKSGCVFAIQNSGIEGNKKHGLWVTYQQDPYFLNPPFVGTDSGNVNISSVYFENNGNLDPAVYSQSFIDGSNADQNVTEISFRNCMFNTSRPNAVCVKINGIVRNIEFVTCEFFSWGSDKKHLDIGSFYTDYDMRTIANIRTTGCYLFADNIAIDGASSAQRDVWAREIIGATASGFVTMNGIQFTVEKKGSMACLRLNGTATSAISQDIDFTTTGLNLRTITAQEIVPQRLYGYRVQSKTTGSLIHAEISAGTVIQAESFMFQTVR